eukprot:CAMPEP_0184387646 /NCGR_PEP_ID=MMETSP0007-20130409/10914_1 /TAXON_ID=97485 /ORGANISM="Prymnesium parvum, Strain Texoma1" /LENGTH=210 /DNA_ID=CAMNT_0026736127 /DNA_START=215 /DNA_END=848 /DNA_ORIENTATION=-
MVVPFRSLAVIFWVMSSQRIGNDARAQFRGWCHAMPAEVAGTPAAHQPASLSNHRVVRGGQALRHAQAHQLLGRAGMDAHRRVEVSLRGAASKGYRESLHDLRRMLAAHVEADDAATLRRVAQDFAVAQVVRTAAERPLEGLVVRVVHLEPIGPEYLRRLFLTQPDARVLKRREDRRRHHAVVKSLRAAAVQPPRQEQPRADRHWRELRP